MTGVVRIMSPIELRRTISMLCGIVFWLLFFWFLVVGFVFWLLFVGLFVGLEGKIMVKKGLFGVIFGLIIVPLRLCLLRNC